MIKTTVATITPDRARDEVEMWGTSNYRPSRDAHVKELARDMTADKWVLTGTPIIYNADGMLVDGLHRMRACVLAGVPFTSVVVRGVENEAVDIIDTQITPRSIGDVLNRHGVGNQHARGATARMILAWKAGVLADSHKIKLEISNSVILEFVLANEEAVREATNAGDRTRKAVGALAKITGAFYFLAAEIDQDTTDRFFDSLISGVGLQSGDPILALRSWMLSKSVNRVHVRPEEAAYACARTWGAWRVGDELRLLKVVMGGRGDSRSKIPTIA